MRMQSLIEIELNTLINYMMKVMRFTIERKSANSNTVAEKTELTIQQLKDWSVKFTSFSMGKPAYDIWIDDKAHNVDDYFLKLTESSDS